MYWEFATDSYDIGFGVYFEWGKPTTNEVSVMVCDSDDDDEEEEYDEGKLIIFGENPFLLNIEFEIFLITPSAEVQPNNDLESGSVEPVSPPSPVARFRPPISSVVPVYRRECQTEVYVGSHNYPGEGVYLLKFDNSYSLWRSKTLYYRVFYTR